MKTKRGCHAKKFGNHTAVNKFVYSSVTTGKASGDTAERQRTTGSGVVGVCEFEGTASPPHKTLQNFLSNKQVYLFSQLRLF